jgi:hypothetical protein
MPASSVRGQLPDFTMGTETSKDRDVLSNLSYSPRCSKRGSSWGILSGLGRWVRLVLRRFLWSISRYRWQSWSSPVVASFLFGKFVLARSLWPLLQCPSDGWRWHLGGGRVSWFTTRHIRSTVSLLSNCMARRRLGVTCRRKGQSNK